jgi:hypothetical protein
MFVCGLALGPSAHVSADAEEALSALNWGARPPGARFRAQVFFTCEYQEPLSLVVVGHVGASGEWRVDVDWRLAPAGKTDIFQYREGMVYLWADPVLTILPSYLTRNPIRVRPGEAGQVDTGMARSGGSMNLPVVDVYLRGQKVMRDWPAWTTSVEVVQAGPRAGQYAITRKPPEPIKFLEPHVIAMQRYYVSPDLRLVGAETYDPAGNVVATTTYSDFASLASGAKVPLRSVTEMSPGSIGARATRTTSINDQPPKTEAVWEQLPWARCRVDREMQVIDGKYVLPRRTTTSDREGRVLDDVEYLSVEVGPVPDSIFRVDTEAPKP